METAPVTSSIYASPACNLRCSFCRRQEAGLPEETPFTTAQAEQLVNTFPSLKSVCVAGFGEPLCNPWIDKVILTTLDRGLFTSLITNGVLVEKFWRLVPWTRLGYVNISLNAATESEHERICGVKGAYEKSLKGLRMLASIGANAGLSFVVDNETWEDIPEMLHLASRYQASFVSIVNTLPHHDVSDEAQNEDFWGRVITDETKDYVRERPELEALARSLHVNVNAWPVPISKVYNPRLCRSPFLAVGVSGKGHFGGCQRVMPPSAEFGSLSTGAESWKSSEGFSKLREALTEGELLPQCTMCFGNWLG